MNLFEPSIGAHFLYGVRIYYSENCLQETDVPARRYRRRRWQTEAQAARKQKKWTARWGIVKSPCIYATQEAYFAHPSFKGVLEKTLAREAIIKQYLGPIAGLGMYGV